MADDRMNMDPGGLITASLTQILKDATLKEINSHFGSIIPGGASTISLAIQSTTDLPGTLSTAKAAIRSTIDAKVIEHVRAAIAALPRESNGMINVSGAKNNAPHATREPPSASGSTPSALNALPVAASEIIVPPTTGGGPRRHSRRQPRKRGRKTRKTH